MGSSVKKKRDKKKDFQKPKLKVGKARPQATNHTNTSFKSKAIALNSQSLHVNSPSAADQFTHHLSLLNSRSDSQRKESLSYLATAIANRPIGRPLQLPSSVLIPKLLPLILDGSNGVRGQVLKLLRTIPPEDVGDSCDKLLLYIRAGMTHLAADIRSSSTDMLAWALEAAGDFLVSCAGGWVKTLKCFLAMLGWPNDETLESWSSSKASFGKAGSEGKIMVKTLNTLGSFIDIGLANTDGVDNGPTIDHFPLVHTRFHVLARGSSAYAHLNLFGSPRDDDSEMYEHYEERRKVLSQNFQKALEKGLESARQEGGETGRAAAAVTKILVERMKDEELDAV
ncbi:rRNA processing protein [Lambiella insularis]|nr:rRNA processing protein [Lambiella insularis]